MIILTVVHRLSQIFSADRVLNKYDSLLAFRKAANMRASFHQTLLRCHDAFCSMAAGMPMDNIPESRQQPAQNVLDCREPRFSFDAELTEWATTSTGMTPHRSVATEYDNFGVPLPVRKRRMECTGRPVYSYHPSKNHNSGRGTCAVCGMLTHIYCVHCHHFTCFQAREKVLLNQQAGILYSTRFDLNGDESEVFFKQFCYHI